MGMGMVETVVNFNQHVDLSVAHCEESDTATTHELIEKLEAIAGAASRGDVALMELVPFSQQLLDRLTTTSETLAAGLKELRQGR